MSTLKHDILNCFSGYQKLIGDTFVFYGEESKEYMKIKGKYDDLEGVYTG